MKYYERSKNRKKEIGRGEKRGEREYYEEAEERYTEKRGRKRR